MTRLEFIAHGQAEPQGSARAFIPKGWKRPVITSDNPNVKDWRAVIALEAGGAMRRTGWVPTTGPVRILARFVLRRPKTLPKRVTAHITKPDLDKLQRALGDALSGVIYRDDSQVTQWKVEKVYTAAGEAPHVVVAIEALAL